MESGQNLTPPMPEGFRRVGTVRYQKPDGRKGSLWPLYIAMLLTIGGVRAAAEIQELPQFASVAGAVLIMGVLFAGRALSKKAAAVSMAAHVLRFTREDASFVDLPHLQDPSAEFVDRYKFGFRSALLGEDGNPVILLRITPANDAIREVWAGRDLDDHGIVFLLSRHARQILSEVTVAP